MCASARALGVRHIIHGQSGAYPPITNPPSPRLDDRPPARHARTPHTTHTLRNLTQIKEEAENMNTQLKSCTPATTNSPVDRAAWPWALGPGSHTHAHPHIMRTRGRAFSIISMKCRNGPGRSKYLRRFGRMISHLFLIYRIRRS